MVPNFDYDLMIRLQSRNLAYYIQMTIIGYVNEYLDIIYDFILPLLYILYHNPELLLTTRRFHWSVHPDLFERIGYTPIYFK